MSTRPGSNKVECSCGLLEFILLECALLEYYFALHQSGHSSLHQVDFHSNLALQNDPEFWSAPLMEWHSAMHWRHN